MNAERLHVIALALHKEIESTKLLQRFEDTVTTLQQLVNQTHPQHQRQLAENLKNLYAALTDTSSDSFSPAWRQAVDEIGGSGLVGASLRSQIEQTLQRNQITLAVALEELRELLKRFKVFRDALDRLVSALGQLNIGQEELPAGECEVGVMVPRAAVNDDLGEFAKELGEVRFILNTLSEIASGGKEHFQIRTLSSSDLTLYLKVLPPLAACVAVAVERIVALYKQLLEIRKLQNELRNQGVPEAQTAGIEEHANSLMAKGIEELSVEIMQQFYKGKDKPRRNELHNGLRISLNKIANRVDRGYHIEVRCMPLDEEQSSKPENKETADHLAKVENASVQLQFFRLEGAPILRLPEATSKPKPDKQ